MDIKRIYWDSCAWLGLINDEENKWPGCQYVMSLAHKGDVEILASTLVLAEVYKTRCHNPYKVIAEEKDILLEDYFSENFIIIASVDLKVTIRARQLLRYYSDKGLKKPQDAIHLATAIIHDADEFHTFDGSDLLCLNGIVKTEGGKLLSIQKPSEPPVEEQYKTSLLDYSTKDSRRLRVEVIDEKEEGQPRGEFELA